VESGSASAGRSFSGGSIWPRRQKPARAAAGVRMGRLDAKRFSPVIERGCRHLCQPDDQRPRRDQRSAVPKGHQKRGGANLDIIRMRSQAKHRKALSGCREPQTDLVLSISGQLGVYSLLRHNRRCDFGFSAFSYFSQADADKTLLP
jgi:hypothetical protein